MTIHPNLIALRTSLPPERAVNDGISSRAQADSIFSPSSKPAADCQVIPVVNRSGRQAEALVPASMTKGATREDIHHRNGRCSRGVLGACADDKIPGRFEQRAGSTDAEHDEAFDRFRRLRIRAGSSDQYNCRTGPLGKCARTEDAEHHGFEHHKEVTVRGQSRQLWQTAPTYPAGAVAL
ncbi:hypothetical protein [Bradyrhizobium sp. CCBAU 25338]|uniref:hypothetical protein n=1 Tax=Bradyrhizobium sp. CCBAU 25338 TaxID=1641877 RepID=UPI0023037A5D|nr:hypothetical protein [Bradyrhizobium sp. CCBAU 25338]